MAHGKYDRDKRRTAIAKHCNAICNDEQLLSLTLLWISEGGLNFSDIVHRFSSEGYDDIRTLECHWLIGTLERQGNIKMVKGAYTVVD